MLLYIQMTSCPSIFDHLYVWNFFFVPSWLSAHIHHFSVSSVCKLPNISPAFFPYITILSLHFLNILLLFLHSHLSDQPHTHIPLCSPSLPHFLFHHYTFNLPRPSSLLFMLYYMFLLFSTFCPTAAILKPNYHSVPLSFYFNWAALRFQRRPFMDLNDPAHILKVKYKSCYLHEMLWVR